MNDAVLVHDEQIFTNRGERHTEHMLSSSPKAASTLNEKRVVTEMPYPASPRDLQPADAYSA
ncbi:MAG: hypothetical protein MN733_00165 [Nitrososphaera sp.]|nr:hypothetical protein [Nitrososphaera sp.]